jgi:hypothetical protein
MAVRQLSHPAIPLPATRIRVRTVVYMTLGVVTSAVLLYSAARTTVRHEFPVLWEATPVLAGDHPYRDFYEMGWPLMTLMSAAVQWAVGYRLIGEFLIQWTFIVASVS